MSFSSRALTVAAGLLVTASRARIVAAGLLVTSSRARTVAAGLLVTAAMTGSAAAATAYEPDHADQTPRWVWPLEPIPTVVRGFVAPADPWGPGHRGVDLLGRPGEPVLAIASGEVLFAQALAGRGVVVIRHGALRSTYEPVTAAVRVGQHVDAGQVIGLLQATHSHCAPEVCLHLGLRRGRVYLDPLSVLGPRAVRLKPLTPADLAWGSASAGPGDGGPAGHEIGAARSGPAPAAAGVDAAPHPGSGRGRAVLAATAAGLVFAVTSMLGLRAGGGHARG
jgi:murein DD-endopeptidase MepM/ murein hydrolase activator NlpD